MNSTNKIAVTIITGFLGSGKTTFINELLKKYHDQKFALIENEFGEVSIDSHLIKGVNASQMFELKNGCICCTITDEYEQALTELAKQFHWLDHLVIETSGIADPAPVISPFFCNDDIKKLYRYHGTVCLVDAINFHRYPAKRVALKQLALADSVIITKIEDFGIQEREKFDDEIRQLNPLAEIYQSSFGVVAGFKLHNLIHINRIISDLTSQKNLHEHVQVQTYRYQKAFNKESFIEKLDYNLDIYKTAIYRIKGIICFEEEPYRYILQGVGGSFELTESDIIQTSGLSELVIIGNLRGVEFSID